MVWWGCIFRTTFTVPIGSYCLTGTIPQYTTLPASSLVNPISGPTNERPRCPGVIEWDPTMFLLSKLILQHEERIIKGGKGWKKDYGALGIIIIMFMGALNFGQKIFKY